MIDKIFHGQKKLTNETSVQKIKSKIITHQHNYKEAL